MVNAGALPQTTQGVAAEAPAALSAGTLFADASAEVLSVTFQTALWELLAKQVSLYTLGESSSLPEYDAYRLLASTCFVLGVDVANLDQQDMQAICNEGIGNVYERKLHAIENEVRRIETLWKEVCLATPLLESVALKDTLESLRDFKARYEPRFFAHEIPADIDYPLCQPIDETEKQGVHYVAAYLERLLVENRFLQCFDQERCLNVLRAVHPQYSELIVNLFEPVAVNALGCALVKGDVRALRFGPKDYSQIALLAQNCSTTQLKRLLAEAASTACDALGLRGNDAGAVRTYARTLAVGLVERIRMAKNS